MGALEVLRPRLALFWPDEGYDEGGEINRTHLSPRLAAFQFLVCTRAVWL